MKFTTDALTGIKRILIINMCVSKFLSWLVATIVIFTSNQLIAFVKPDLIINGPPPVFLPRSAQILVDMETEANPVSVRSNHAFWIEHLEIPLAALSENLGLGLDERVRKSLVFLKNGVPHVRWILNPEDQIYGERLEQSLINNNITFSKERYFIGYLTASRSCIVQDPGNGFVFSIRASTNVTGGSWQFKKLTEKDADQARFISDYLQSHFNIEDSKTLDFVKEPLSFSFAGADQAIVVRQYDQFNDIKQNRFLIPLFSVMHPKGAEIADKFGKLEGLKGPIEFWRKHAMVPIGKAAAEFALNLGLVLESPHGQNILLELDQDMHPTGKVVYRDLGDIYALLTIFSKVAGRHLTQKLTELFSEKYIFNQTGTLHGSVLPMHASQDRVNSWAENESPEAITSWRIAFATSFSYRIEKILANTFGDSYELTSSLTLEINRWAAKVLLKRDLANKWLSHLENKPHLNSNKGDMCSALFLPNF